MTTTAAFASRFAVSGMVCAVDHLAASAGVDLLRAGGTAADAAVGASAVLAVTTQHMCGMGGDLFAIVGEQGRVPTVLNASGRAGSGADPDRLRADGHAVMPASDDIRVVPVPGCVDGWLALHERYGRLPLGQVLAPALGYAAAGFPAAPSLVAAAPTVRDRPGGADFAAATSPGALVRRPGVARALGAVVRQGRAGFYGGEFGAGLLRLGGGEYAESDLAEPLADWVPPLGIDVWGQRLWTVPPNSQGYLTLAASWIAERLDLPADPADPLWAHLTVEAARQASYDRLEVLSEHADGAVLVHPDRLEPRRAAIDPDRAAALGDSYRAGGTIYLCAVDSDRMAVSLIQSNAAGFGSGLAEPSTGIFLHNRGVGFSLEPGHPAEYRPGRRPPHTLSPALLTTSGNRLHTVLGTMGGDSQPQILLQLLARMLAAGEDPGRAVAAPRWALANPADPGGFGTWRGHGDVKVELEHGVPGQWGEGLSRRGHRVAAGPVHTTFGHAHVIRVLGDVLEGASDPRSLAGGALGY